MADGGGQPGEFVAGKGEGKKLEPAAARVHGDEVP
jgi:hypothetical protein